MRILLPILLALLGTGAGIGAGTFLAPPTEEVAEVHECPPPTSDAMLAEDLGAEKPPPKADPMGQEVAGLDYVKLNNQFVVPVLKDGKVNALVVLSLNLEVTPGGSEVVFEREPKLRDTFLQVLFDHANTGRFDGAFTQSTNMILLRDALLEAGRKTLGPVVNDVLIIDIVRQDVEG